MKKHTKKYTPTTIINIIFTGVTLYAIGIFILGWLTVSTGGGLGLFGTQSRGIGATFGLFLTTWVYMFPFVYLLGVMYKYSDPEKSTNDKMPKK